MTMRKRSLLARLVFAAFVTAAPALAADHAPTDQYEQFVRTDPTVRDHYTKLEWDRSRLGKNIDFGAAGFQCSTVALPPVGRIPTIKELLTIFDEEPHTTYEFGKNVQKYIDPAAFDGFDAVTPIDLPYWSSTPASPTQIWALDFATGAMVMLDKTSGKANVRCVQ